MSGIISFIEDVIGDKSLSLAQRVILKSVYGEPMGREELAMFRELTGLERYRAKERDELTIIAGRGSGKSNQIASNLAIYEAVGRKHQLAVGEIAAVTIISTEQKRQSRIEFNYILKKMQGSPALRAMIESTTTDEIRLRNGVIIMVMPCNLARVRGASIQMCIADELGFWRSEGASVDREVLEAVRPGLRLPHSKLIKISSPYWMRGELHHDFKHYYGKDQDDVLVFQAPTELLNPAFSKKKLEAARKRDPLAFATEYEAEFRTDLSGLLDPVVIEQAVDRGRPMELPYRRQVGPYYAFVDGAGGGGKDSYAISIAHLEGEKVVVDVVQSRRPKFNPLAVTAEYAALLKGYGITQVEGDKFSGDILLNDYAQHGITYERAPRTKSEIYLEAEKLFNTGRIAIPEKEPLVTQLRGLVRKVHAGGKDSVDSDGGTPEDEANAMCGVAVKVSLETAQGRGAFFAVIQHDVRPDDGGGREYPYWGHNIPVSPAPQPHHGPRRPASENSFEDWDRRNKKYR